MATAQSDAIRIVPLKLPDAEIAAGAPPGAQLTYRGGPLLGAVQLYTIFWGAEWKRTAADLMVTINQFCDFVVTSELLDQLAEYGTAATPIVHGVYAGSAAVEQPAPAASLGDADIRALLQSQINSNPSVPAVSANTLYLVYLPPGVTVEQGGTFSCQDFCGYHDAINGKLFYGVIPYPGCSGCSSSLQASEAVTVTTSHELCEAVTDPVPGQGWYDDANGEIGDICAWQTKRLGSYTVQLEWSNSAQRCI